MVTFESSGLNSRTGLNALKAVAYEGLLKVAARPSTGAWMKPSPLVVKRPPRLTRNPSNGVGTMDVAVEPPPSQLISRRPSANRPGGVAVVRAADRRAEGIDHALNRCGAWTGGLEHDGVQVFGFPFSAPWAWAVCWTLPATSNDKMPTSDPMCKRCFMTQFPSS